MAASTLVLVGWDEVKCRPIYQRQSESAAGRAVTKKVKKSKVKIGKTDGVPAGITRNCRHGKTNTAPVASSVGELLVQEIVPFDNGSGGKGRRRVYDWKKASNKRRKARTISLSPEHTNGMGERLGDDGSNDDQSIITSAIEEKAIKDSRASIILGVGPFKGIRKRKNKGYGTKNSHHTASNAMGSVIGWDTQSNYFVSNNAMAGFSPNNQNLSPLEKQLEDEIEETCSVLQGNHFASTSDVSFGSSASTPTSNRKTQETDHSEGDLIRTSNDEMIGSDASIQSTTMHSPKGGTPVDSRSGPSGSTDTTQTKNGHLHSPGCEEASHHHDSEDVCSDDPRDGMEIFSPNSKDSFGNNQHYNPRDQSDGSINSGDSMEDEGPDGCPVAEFYDNKSSQAVSSTRTRNSIDTPDHCVGRLHAASSNERDHGMDFDPTNDTPSTKGERSTATTPNTYQHRRSNNDEFEEFDVTFDETKTEQTEPNQKQRQKRRSYGDTKPVWMPKQTAATPDVASKVIGWDDAKCRPIYHAPAARKLPTSTTDSPIDKSSARTNDGGYAAFSAQKEADGNKKAQKKRVYTSLFNKRSGLTQADRDRMHIDSPTTGYTPNPASIMGQPCHANNTLAEDPCSEDGESTGVTSKAGVDEQNGTSLESLDVDLEIEAITNDTNSNRPRPHSKSSLESARAFFRYLDSNHNLTILDQGDERRVKMDVIRTSRMIDHSEELRAEYSEYCKTCAGIEPISLDDFANNWNLYFTGKGIVRDGLLDEE